MKVLEGTINRRAREARDTGDEGDTPSPQLFGIDGSDKVLLSLVQMGEQRGISLLKLFLFAHAGSITRASYFVTINILRDLIRYGSCGSHRSAGSQRAGHAYFQHSST